jgi:hypothetical protein
MVRSLFGNKNVKSPSSSVHKRNGEVENQKQIRKSDKKAAITLIYKLRAITVRRIRASVCSER